MLLDVQDSVLLVSESLGRVVSAEPLDEGDSRLGDVARELDVVDAAKDDVVDLHGIAGSERGTGNKVIVNFKDPMESCKARLNHHTGC